MAAAGMSRLIFSAGNDHPFSLNHAARTILHSTAHGIPSPHEFSRFPAMQTTPVPKRTWAREQREAGVAFFILSFFPWNAFFRHCQRPTGLDRGDARAAKVFRRSSLS